MSKSILLASLFLLICGSASALEVWNQKANIPAVARHRTTAFSIGNKGYIGLGHYNSGPNGNIYLQDFWEYDPSSNSWTQKADFAGGPRYHTVGIGYGDKAYVGTGRHLIVPPTTFQLEADWWEFDPIANTWTLKAPFPGLACRGAVSFIIDEFIFVGTGQTGSGATTQFFAYDIINDQWLGNVAPFPGAARTSAVAFSIEDKGYVGTGGWGCGSNDFYEYKLSTNTWIQRADIGGPIRNEAFGCALNGKGIIGTGDNCSSGTNYKDFWQYDPGTDTWSLMEEFDGSARRYMNGFVIGNKMFCGSGTSGVNYNDWWEYDALFSSLNKDENLLSINNYPNPMVTHTTFQLENIPSGVSLNEIELKIFDMQGKQVWNERFEENKILMQRGDLNSGTYIYSIWYDETALKQSKLIVL